MPLVGAPPIENMQFSWDMTGPHYCERSALDKTSQD